MRQEGNIVVLNKNELFYSTFENDRYWLEFGEVQIFVVEWFDAEITIDRQAGRGVPLLQLHSNTDENIEIPSLCHTDDTTGKRWRLCLKALEDETRLQIRSGASIILKRNFLQKAGIHTFEAEGGKNNGYENSLISFYHGKKAAATALIDQMKENEKITKTKSLKMLANGMTGRDVDVSASSNHLYQAVAFAASKCGIQAIASEERVVAACEKEEITVPDIAKTSHFISREVLLDIDWYKHDCGAIIAFLQKESSHNGQKQITRHPVSCYLKGSKYFFFDPETGLDQPLSKQAADSLENKAYSIRRTLPCTKLTAKEIVAFVWKGIQSRDIIQLVVLGIICALIGALLPKLNQLIYDEYIPMGNANLLAQICFVIVSCMIGKVFISIGKTLQEYRVPARAGYELQDALYHRLFELPEQFYQEYDSADLANRVLSVTGIANSLVSKTFTHGFSLIISIIYWIQMIRYSGKLTLACLLMLAIYGVLVFFLSSSSVKHIKQIEEYKGEADGKLFQLISGVEKIRMAGAEERAVLEYSTPVANEKRLSNKLGRLGTLLAILTDASSTIFTMILYFLMIKTKVGIGMGAFMAFSTAFGSVSSTVLDFVQALTDYAQMKPLIKRVSPLLQTAPEDDTDKDLISDLTGNIALNQVSFRYLKDQPPVLNNLSLQIFPGEYVAIVGPSGCGKSTLLKLLLGFVSPDQGQVLYDGKDISTINKHSLRRKMGVVLQNGRLIAGSIFENVTITASAPDMKKVWKILDDVGLREDVEEMPMGIQTPLSESGGTISGGQQQRLLIARAIYNDPKVLFFDEATSALDNLTQAKVCESLEKRCMTRVVIAHRLSTVKKCDRILYLDKGSVAEEGTFEELMNLKGRFYEMARRQIV